MCLSPPSQTRRVIRSAHVLVMLTNSHVCHHNRRHVGDKAVAIVPRSQSKQNYNYNSSHGLYDCVTSLIGCQGREKPRPRQWTTSPWVTNVMNRSLNSCVCRRHVGDKAVAIVPRSQSKQNYNHNSSHRHLPLLSPY